MQQISGPDAARAILNSPSFIVPPVPAASAGVAWLRASVARFSTAGEHERKRALATALLDAIPPDSLAAPTRLHPVAVLGRALGAGKPVVGPVQDIAQAYQPGTGDEARADIAVRQLVAIFGGAFDEQTAARIALLVQACDATQALIERSRHQPVHQVLEHNPPARATKRQALTAITADGLTIEAGEVIQVCLAGELAFGAGPHRCPGRAHALALVDAALAAGTQ